jgi:hypothetical protein
MQEHQSDYRLREMEVGQAQMFTTDRRYTGRLEHKVALRRPPILMKVNVFKNTNVHHK